jgi:ABC-2 type transport system ATP-binding protein
VHPPLIGTSKLEKTMIETKSLSKSYGGFVAVDQLSFRVEPGEVLGFLGPNGAGKSTSMKMIAGFLTPTSGTVNVCGFDTEAQPLEAKRALGYLPEGAPAYGEMTPLTFLKFVGAIRGLGDAELRKRIDTVIGQLHLEGVLHQPIEQLSKGFKRRVGIAQALLHDPKVLIMDEPTDGLDPNQKQEVRDLIGGMSKDKIIVISTHILEEVEAVCSRAIIIAKGKLLADATPAQLASRSRYHQAVTLRTEQPDVVREAIKQVEAVADTEFNARESSITALPKPGQAIFSAINELVHQRKLPVSNLILERGRLDEVFRSITQGGRS